MKHIKKIEAVIIEILQHFVIQSEAKDLADIMRIPLMLRLITTDVKGWTLYNAHFLLYYKEQELISFVNKKKWVN